MDKLSISSANKSAYSFIETAEVSNWDLTRTPKRFLHMLVSNMSTFFISYHQKRVVKYQRVLAKLEHQSKEYATTAIETTPVPLAISKEILEAVQLKLHAFETQKLFLNQELSLSSLAKLLGTNSSYLSKIINHTKGKSFKHYLNDMRIDHAYYDLKAHPKKRKFTIEAIAFDNGFKSAESFSKKFKERFEIYPSVFLKSLAS